LGIEQQVREMAARIFREVQEANLIIGRCLDAAAAATLYVAIRCTNSDRPVGEIVNVARGCDSNKIFDLANLYRRELDLKIPLQAISDLLPNYLDDLGIYDRDTEAAIRNVALSIADDLEPMAETSGKSRRGLSAGIVRALVDSSSFDCHLQSISTAHNCSDPTVRERKETIEELIDLEPYLDLLEESLPSKEERTKGSCDQCNRRFETKQDLLFHQQRSPTHEETGGPDVLEVR
jgi:transcription initiation factor TFIIB